MTCNSVLVNRVLYWIIPNEKMSELVEWLDENKYEFRYLPSESTQAPNANHGSCHNPVPPSSY
jgi:hypothetical protein